jgi:hypothetical protein
MANTPLINSFTRVFLIDGQARPDHTPEFLNFLKFGSFEQSFGSVNPVFEPSKSKYGAFDPVAEFRDAEERPTTSMVGHFAREVKSRMLQLAQAGCKFDLQMHIGECENPGIFDDFQKVMIFEGVLIESYSTDDIGALEPGEQSKVDETGDISATRMYEYLPVALAERKPTLVTNELIDVIVCDAASCGNCETESDGCQRLMAISKAAGGSPSTPADVVFSLDGGKNWLAHDIDTLGVAVDPSGIACVGTYVVVVAATDGDAMHIALISEFTATDDPSFTQINTGFVTGGAPQDIWSLGNVAYLVGNGGYIYKTTDPASGVTVIDAGAATISQLNAVHMLSEEFGVAVGNDGVILTINNDLVSALATSPVGVGVDLNCVWVKSETEWFVGSAAGVLYYTLDGGATWTEKTLPGTAPSTVTDIAMASASVMYVAATVTDKGETYVSINGGASFIRMPLGSANAMPNNDGINAIAAFEEDVDFLVGVGLNADGTDGFIVVGND